MNPGSDAAIDAGCTCPVLDNAYGRGVPGMGWWISMNCPIHGRGQRPTQIAACRNPERGFEGSSIPYLAKQDDADARTARGEQQQFCATCERWQWPDRACALFVRDEATERAQEQAARKRGEP